MKMCHMCACFYKAHSNHNMQFNYLTFCLTLQPCNFPLLTFPIPNYKGLLCQPHLLRQQNHIISVAIDDHCHQRSSCPIAFVKYTHPPLSCSKLTPPSRLIQSLVDLFCSSATASITHFHVQLLDLHYGRMPIFNEATV